MRYFPALLAFALPFQAAGWNAVQVPSGPAPLPAAAQEAQEPGPPPPPSPAPRPAVSVFAETLHLGEQPPELRALRVIQVRFEGAVGSPRKNVKTREEAERFAQELRARVAAGADFAELARRHSDASNALNGGLLGVVPPGLLGDALDAWLFSAQAFDLSPVLFTAAGYMLAQRIPERVGARAIQIQGTGPESWARARELLARLEAGQDFAALAGEVNDDPALKERRGAMAVFERGSGDSMIKAAAFDTPLGQVSAPVETPMGLFLVQPVAPESLPPELAPKVWARFNGMLISFDEARLPVAQLPGRNAAEAELVAAQMIERLAAGEDFAELAARFNDDPAGGRERRGDVGWFHRHQPGLPNFLRANFELEPGEFSDPIPLNVGYLILQRTR
jgi:parvulin-like peptidyl-prolyl isomerase